MDLPASLLTASSTQLVEHTCWLQQVQSRFVRSACNCSKLGRTQWPSVAAGHNDVQAVRAEPEPEPEPETGRQGREDFSGLDGSLQALRRRDTTIVKGVVVCVALAFSAILLAALSSRRVHKSRVH